MDMVEMTMVDVDMVDMDMVDVDMVDMDMHIPWDRVITIWWIFSRITKIATKKVFFT